jgi:hypothetical protein
VASSAQNKGKNKNTIIISAQENPDQKLQFNKNHVKKVTCYHYTFMISSENVIMILQFWNVG